MHLDDLLEFDTDLIYESDEEIDITEAQVMAWGRKGNTLIRKYRCPFGKRKSRLVTSLAKCGQPIDLKKRMQLRKTRARRGASMARKSKRTKKFNPASKRLRKLNALSRRK